MKKTHKFLCLLLSVVLSIGYSSIIFAADNFTYEIIDYANTDLDSKIIETPSFNTNEIVRIPVGNAEYIKTKLGELIPITELEVFDSQTEINLYMNSLQVSMNSISNNSIVPYATYGNAKVASQKFGINAYVNLYVDYSTSGNNNTGTITSHSPYTTFTGFTNGMSWEERHKSSRITSSGKDIYATASGEVVSYLLIDGLIEMGRTPANLSGYAYVIR